MIEEIYKKLSKDSGIYKITNIINNKSYIGSSINIQRRIKEHLQRFIKNNHYNCKLQGTFNKYGLENLRFETIATCPKEYNLKLEQWFIDNLKPELNLTNSAHSTLGFKYNKNSRNKIKIAKSGTKNPQAKLTNNQVLDIRSSNLKGTELAKIYNISTSQISMVRNHKSYK